MKHISWIESDGGMMLRGGFWLSNPAYARLTYPGWETPEAVDGGFGFRACRSMK